MGPVALPGLGGPPVWFDPGGGGDWRPELHDPRWSGTPQRLHQFSDVIGHYEDGAYRMIQSGNYLYVSYQAIADASGLSASDRVYFAFTQGTGPGAGNAAWALRIDGDASSPAAAPPPAGPSDPSPPAPVAPIRIRFYETSDATGTNPTWIASGAGSVPPWLDQVAVWRNSPGVAWGVTFRVDIASLAVSPPFKVFHGLRTDHGAPLGVVQLTSSNIGGATFDPLTDSVGTDTIIPKSSMSWTTEVDPAAPVCTSGITFSTANVGVFSGGSLTNVISGCGGTTACPAAGQTNQFRVEAQNVPDPVGQAHTVRARIRIADWGSTYADWKHAPWKEIPNLPHDVFTLPESTLAADPNWQFNWSGGVATIDYTCVAAAGDYCPKLQNIDTEDHQCMLVELAADPTNNNDPAYWFARNALYRNMNYTGLSTAAVPATINIVGMKNATGGARDRDIYLYVQMSNMPDHGQEAIWLDVENMEEARRYATHPPPVPPQADQRDIRRKYSAEALKRMKKDPAFARKAAAVAAARAKQVASRIGGGPLNRYSVPVMSPEQALSDVWPTYKVRVYYDTGKTTKNDDGEVRRILSPMTPFGFYLTHQGPLYGFTHKLEGLAGAQLDQVAPNIYKVRVPNEGSVRVQTTITAEEKPIEPGSDCKCQCKDCAPREHTHPQTVPPHKHCLCNTPGRFGSGWTTFGLPLLLAALAYARRRRLVA